MKTAIFYKSHLGSTKTYAAWIQKKIKANLFLFRQFKKVKIENYDTVIVASGTYIGKMPLVKFLTKAWPYIKDKNIIVIAVGMVSPHDDDSLKSYNSIPEHIRSSIKYFKLPGKIGDNAPIGQVRPQNLKPVFEYLKRL
ncbi:MAG TPA: flavodoxin domain-containing protein [Candidatus Saccharibacteria bacterium]|jgi:menaquinone-dependent protoporphyrinogen IX oxidase|nr:flavodoxin domain-containing protein [Candidatus Saccharibacteria bacterium]